MHAATCRRITLPEGAARWEANHTNNEQLRELRQWCVEVDKELMCS
jgi:hypothetical protein